jgi:uncharacterized membrane protein YhhN
MALCFACGALCFLIGPLRLYTDIVGPKADAVTFSLGALLFTAGGAVQVRLAWPTLGDRLWWAAVVQSIGTLLFNVTTVMALSTTLSNPDYDRLVWRPDAIGSACFLVSGWIAWRATPADHPGRWEAAVNLLGCGLFAISAVAGYVVPERGSELDLAAANWSTAAGAACFLACAAATLRTGHTVKSPWVSRLERTVERLV